MARRAALGKALSEAYVDCATTWRAPWRSESGAAMPAIPPHPPRGEACEAAAAARRLDDTFRSYLAERGAKPMPLAEVTSLVTGVAGVRLAADAVLDLWEGDGSADGDRSAAPAASCASSPS